MAIGNVTSFWKEKHPEHEIDLERSVILKPILDDGKPAGKLGCYVFEFDNKNDKDVALASDGIGEAIRYMNTLIPGVRFVYMDVHPHKKLTEDEADKLAFKEEVADWTFTYDDDGNFYDKDGNIVTE